MPDVGLALQQDDTIVKLAQVFFAPFCCILGARAHVIGAFSISMTLHLAVALIFKPLLVGSPNVFV